MDTPEFDMFCEHVWQNAEKHPEAAEFYLSKKGAIALVDEIRNVKLQASRGKFLEEQLVKFQRFLDERDTEEMRCLRAGNTTTEQVAGLISHYEHQRNSALNLLGSLVENQVISLRALQLIVKQCYGLTHRQQSARLDVVEATIKEAISALMDEKSRDWEYMESDWFGRKDWDFRKLVAENRRLQMQLKEAQGETPDPEISF